MITRDAPAPGEPTVDVSWLPRNTVLVVLGGEHDLGSAPDLSVTFDRVLAGCSHLVVDLSASEFIDSTTIGALMRAKRLADERGCRFNLVLGTASIVERALEVSGVVPTLNVVPTVDRALAQ